VFQSFTVEQKPEHLTAGSASEIKNRGVPAQILNRSRNVNPATAWFVTNLTGSQFVIGKNGFHSAAGINRWIDGQAQNTLHRRPGFSIQAECSLMAGWQP
jgi:hypothetical protein